MDNYKMYPLNSYPAFNKFVQKVFIKSPMQKKRILKHFATKDLLFWQRAEGFSKGFSSCLADEEISLDDAVDAYLRVCRDMLVAQIQFARTGVYNCQSSDVVNKTVYSNPEIMSYHMQGIALSQFLWPNHYAMYDFFCQELATDGNLVQSYLEIGAGHGLFLSKALEMFKNASFTVVDISEVSINMARKIIHHMSECLDKVQFQHQDVMLFDDKPIFDFITMGEVLEHVENPKFLLDKIYKLLKPKGRAYISTCCNCASIDHIYLFKNVEDIRKLFAEARLNIDREIVLPVETISKDKSECREINYAAIVTRKEM